MKSKPYPRRLGDAVNQIARQSLGREWEHYAALLEHWEEIVGPDFAATTTPIRISFPHQPNEPRRRNGTLTVKLPKGLTMEFGFKAETVRKRVNTYFGYDAIGKIVYDPVFGAPNPLKASAAPKKAQMPNEWIENINSLNNNELGDALSSLAQVISDSDDHLPKP